MRQPISRVLACAVAALLGGAAVASAQLFESVEATVDHPFVVENTTLPAGKYLVEPLRVEGSRLLLIRPAGGTTIHQPTVEFLATDVTRSVKAEKAELVFEVVDGKYFLHQIWLDGESSGFEVEASRSQRAAERHADATQQMASVTGRRSKNSSGKS